MEFSRPSCFLREIDPQYIESEIDFRAERQRPAPSEEGLTAIDELRRRFDYRFQQKKQEEQPSGSYSRGNSYGNYNTRSADGESGRVQRFSRQNDPYRKQGSTSYPNMQTRFEPRVEQAINTLKEGPRRLVRTAPSSQTGSTPLSDCAYHAGDRVEHTLFGRGEILRIEQANGDWKLIVDFPNAGQKTLLAKFAKLRKL